jgi:hypothetical protein
MGTRDKLKRLQKMLQGNLGYIEQRDGSSFYFDPEETTIEMFGYFSESLTAVHRGEERPDPPPIIHAIVAARDREKAFRTVFPEGCAFMVLDERELVEKGKIVKRRVSTSEKLDAPVLEDLSE